MHRHGDRAHLDELGTRAQRENRTLIVEDNTMVLEVLEEMLERGGPAVQEAVNRADASATGHHNTTTRVPHIGFHRLGSHRPAAGWPRW
jgi:hypothetical protein